MPRRRLALVVALVALALPASASATITKSFTHAGLDSMTVPTWVTSVHVHAIGGSGGSADDGHVTMFPGHGADVATDLLVGAGTPLFVLVGANGAQCGRAYNGGGAPGECGAAVAGGWYVGGGGGASDVRTVAGDPASRLVVAAGGGGAGSHAGGGNAGAPGDSSAPECTPPGPGTQIAGGAAGAVAGDCRVVADFQFATAGSFGQGGDGGRWNIGHVEAAGGGGGGGWYGGGGALGNSSGAGGSSHVAPTASNTTIGTTTQGPMVQVSYPGFPLSVTTTGPANTAGYVTGSPGNIDCGYGTGGHPGCGAEYAPGDGITLTAHPDARSSFTGFTGGGCSGGGLTCVVTMSQAQQVTATFARKKATNTLAVTVGGGGPGTITGPGGLDCGGAGHTACTVEVTPSASITLTAHPGDDAYTANWSGCAPVTLDTCTLDVSGNQTYTAAVAFERNPRTLHVTPAGTGGGTVTGPGIDCGGGPTHSDCVELLPYGTKATLTATPAANSDFTGFGGGGCAGGACTVTMTADATVTATFGLKQRTLWVLPIGNGTATITGPGIDCGPAGHDDCSEPFPDGTAVELTVTLAPGTQLAGIVGGGCAASPCTVAMTVDTTVLAFVSLIPRTLSVAGDGSGTGYVDASPAGIDCGRGVPGHAACAKDYDNGTVVTLTAYPAAGSAF
ncbi:MAG TPA: glycine-rich protein, partial [Baekduia sp.]|nr:glycine-rich protein [Baekduia sp.]